MRSKFYKFLFIVGIFVIIVAIGFTLWVRDRYVVPIMTYHHIGKPAGKSLDLNSVSEDSFEFQMKYLIDHDYRVISFNDLVEGLKKGHSFARNTVVIQFDDGYEDNYLKAFPILKKYQLPAMVFLVSDSIGTEGYLNWDQIKEMERFDFLAGAHTRSHKYLPSVSLNEAKDEVEGSKELIEKNLGHPIDYFVYPSGGFTPEVQAIVKELGFKAAATTNRGFTRIHEDLYALKRIRMNEGDNRFGGLILWCKLSGYYNLFRESKSGY